MDYFVEQAPSDYEVQALIRKKYGDRARILARKEVRTGGVFGLFRRRAIEVTGYCAHAPQSRATPRGSYVEERQKILAAARPEREGGPQSRTSGTSSHDGGGGAAPESTARSEGTSVPGSAKHVGSTQSPYNADDSTNDQSQRVVDSHSLNGSSTASADFGTVLAEIRSIKEQMHGGGVGGPSSIGRLREVLEENDFSRGFIEETVAELHGSCTFDQLNDFDVIAKRAVERISQSIEIYPWQERRRTPHVFVLVGPTGVGKTTTIAKLAAMYGAVADPSYDVRILTIDSYRIGALQQIEKYGEIMGIPVHAVETVGEMEKQLALNKDADFIFVDTIGKSPNDFAKLADVNRLVRVAGGEVHLAVSATTKRSDMLDIFRHFEPFNYQGVVITKLDETSTVGGVLSALQEKRKSVSFITDGQSVPQDIERARRHTFLRRLRDLPVQRHEPEPAYKE